MVSENVNVRNSNKEMPAFGLLVIDLEKLKSDSIKNEVENLKFKELFKGKTPARIDKLFRNIFVEVASQIDCTQCGNCCAKLVPNLTNSDSIRLAKHLNILKREFIDKYTGYDSAEREKYIKGDGCPFLINKKCSVYEARPEVCRSYPHLHLPAMATRLWGVIGNYEYCPIVYYVLEKLKVVYGNY